MRDRAAVGFTVMVFGALGAVAVALVSQYAFDMQPCAWCVLQRLIFLVIAGVSALALWLRRPMIRAMLGGTLLLLAACGIASALYQYFVASDLSSCRLSLAQRIISDTLQLDTLLPSVFEIRVGCAAGATTMLGIPYEFWSLAAFGLLMMALAATAQAASTNFRRR